MAEAVTLLSRSRLEGHALREDPIIQFTARAHRADRALELGAEGGLGETTQGFDGGEGHQLTIAVHAVHVVRVLRRRVEAPRVELGTHGQHLVEMLHVCRRLVPQEVAGDGAVGHAERLHRSIPLSGLDDAGRAATCVSAASGQDQYDHDGKEGNVLPCNFLLKEGWEQGQNYPRAAPSAKELILDSIE